MTAGGRGVNVVGYLSAEIGLGQLGRLTVRGMHAASVRCAAVDLPTNLHASRARATVPPATASWFTYDHDLFVVNADQLPRVRGALNALGAPVPRSTAVLCAWETEHFPFDQLAAFAGIDLVLTISEHAAQAIRWTAKAAGMKLRVEAVPVPVDGAIVRPLASRAELGLPDGPLVMTCFDYYSVVERKNPIAAIAAYRAAVPEPGTATLLVKSINGDDRAADVARVQAAAEGRDDIMLIDEYWDDARVRAAMAHSEVYVSLHRAEGFGHTIGEAMAEGTAVVATGYSGSTAFTAGGAAAEVPYALVDIPDGIQPYSGTGRWAEPDVGAAAAELRRLLHDPAARAEVARRGRERVASMSLDSIGRAITAAMGFPPRPRLGVIVPSSRDWHHGDEVLSALVEQQQATTDIEVVLACAGPKAAPPVTREGVRYVVAEGDDVFSARAAGAVATDAEVVALLEDHSYPGETWASDVLDVWNANPDADAVVHTITCGPSAGVWEVAVFTLTFGPFLPPLDAVPAGRLPVPGIVSLRRTALPDVRPANGWLEYQLLAQLLAAGTVVVTDRIAPLHVQPLGCEALVLLYHSGRTFSGSQQHPANGRMRAAVSRLRNDVPTLVRESFAGRRRVNGGRLGWRVAAAIVAVILAHACGQLVGVATRSTGRSPAALQ